MLFTLPFNFSPKAVRCRRCFRDNIQAPLTPKVTRFKNSMGRSKSRLCHAFIERRAFFCDSRVSNSRWIIIINIINIIIFCMNVFISTHYSLIAHSHWWQSVGVVTASLQVSTHVRVRQCGFSVFQDQSTEYRGPLELPTTQSLEDPLHFLS